jgi:hypothetical protein
MEHGAHGAAAGYGAVLDLCDAASEAESEAGAGGGAAAGGADEGGDAAGGDAAEDGLVGEEEGMRAALWAELQAELWAELEEERAVAARLGSALQPLPPPPEELDEFGVVGTDRRACGRWCWWARASRRMWPSLTFSHHHLM